MLDLLPLVALGAFLALPLGLTGLTRAWLEYRSSADGRTSRPRAVTGAALSLLGTAAAVAYLVFLGTHPQLPFQKQPLWRPGSAVAAARPAAGAPRRP